MGQSAEKMAKENGITREEQDAIALASHRNGWAATEDGRLPYETCAVFVPPRYEAVTADNLLRRDTSPEALAALPPVFDKRNGSVSAGNSSALTDGAAAVLLMSEDKARAEGREPLAFVRSWAVAAVDPGGQLLMGPALAVPKALERAGVELSDIDLIEMHEAFAAQVASNIQALESETWAREKLGRSEPVGKVDRCAAQRLRRLDRPRPSLRGHGRPARHDARERDDPPRRPARPGLGVRPGWHGLRNGAGAMSGAFAGEWGADGVLVVTLDVPGEKVNTLGRERMAEFEALLDEVERDPSLRAVVIRSGKPDNFIAGADIKDFTRIQRPRRARRSRGPLRRCWTASRAAASPWWRRSTAAASAAGPSWRSPAAIGWPRTTRRP